MVLELTWIQVEKWILTMFSGVKVVFPKGYLLSCFSQCWRPGVTKTFSCCCCFSLKCCPSDLRINGIQGLLYLSEVRPNWFCCKGLAPFKDVVCKKFCPEHLSIFFHCVFVLHLQAAALSGCGICSLGCEESLFIDVHK